jgi:ATP-dependent Clp protease ATP-binding subunit ClpA
MLTQQKLGSVTSESCDLALVLFDEIEKAAPSMTRLLMGVLDKAVLRLGDNSTVNFERTLIFLTSNLGAREMRDHIRPGFGFQAAVSGTGSTQKLHQIGMGAVRRHFAPEFVNRIDTIVTYLPLNEEALADIVDLQVAALELHIDNRLGERAFELDVSAAARRFLLDKGTSSEYGARELKRTILRELTQPLAAMVANHEVPPEAMVRVHAARDGARLIIDVID